MQVSVILQIVIELIILFIAVNYFVYTSFERKMVNNIIFYKNNEDKTQEDKLQYLRLLRSNYYKKRMKMVITRGIIFGVGAWILINYNIKNNSVQQPMPTVPQITVTPVKYFDVPPF